MTEGSNLIPGHIRKLEMFRSSATAPSLLSQLSFEDISQFFDIKLEDACKIVGLSTTSMKKLCRNFAVERWPYRKVQSLNGKKQKLQESINTTPNMSEQVRIRLDEQLKKVDKDIAKLKTVAYYQQKKLRSKQKKAQNANYSSSDDDSMDDDDDEDDKSTTSTTTTKTIGDTEDGGSIASDNYHSEASSDSPTFKHHQHLYRSKQHANAPSHERVHIHIPKAQKFEMQKDPTFHKPILVSNNNLLNSIDQNSSGFRPFKPSKINFAKNLPQIVEQSLQNMPPAMSPTRIQLTQQQSYQHRPVYQHHPVIKSPTQQLPPQSFDFPSPTKQRSTIFAVPPPQPQLPISSAQQQPMQTPLPEHVHSEQSLPSFKSLMKTFM